MTFRDKIQDLQRAEVVDSTGDKIGKVGQVYLTNDTQEPSWVTVNTGLFGGNETFIPLDEAKLEGDVITVPYEKSFIKDAPNVEEDGEISREEEDELYRYYGIQDGLGGTNQGQHDQVREGEQVHADHNRDAALAGTAGAGAGAGLDADRDRVAQQDQAVNQGADSVTLHEEQVNVGTERVETGQARLRKYVVTETERVEVPVQREEVVLERTPASGDHTGTIGEEEVSVTLSEERPVVNKETVATEDVSLGKRQVEETQRVDTQVSHEEVEVDGVQQQTREGELPRDGQDRI